MKDELEAKVVYVRDAPTKCEARRYQIATGNDIRFPARAAPYHRKQFIITNRGGNSLQLRVSNLATHAEPAQALLPGVDAGPIGVNVFSQAVIVVFTSDSIWVRNANTNGITIEFDVMESWYT